MAVELTEEAIREIVREELAAALAEPVPVNDYFTGRMEIEEPPLPPEPEPEEPEPEPEEAEPRSRWWGAV